MGKIYKAYLSGRRVYACASCGTHLSTHGDIISKAFNGRHGRAYLFDKVVNVTAGVAEERMLTTGLHTVADIHCNICRVTVGWTYVCQYVDQYEAYEDDQKYKVGKFILEKALLARTDTVTRADTVARAVAL